MRCALCSLVTLAALGGCGVKPVDSSADVGADADVVTRADASCEGDAPACATPYYGMACYDALYSATCVDGAWSCWRFASDCWCFGPGPRGCDCGPRGWQCDAGVDASDDAPTDAAFGG